MAIDGAGMTDERPNSNQTSGQIVAVPNNGCTEMVTTSEPETQRQTQTDKQPTMMTA